MHKHRSVKRAFTLIEILIVVVILGILAAIVIPQFTSAAEDAKESSAKSQLQTIRAQIELYRFQPPLDAQGNPIPLPNLATAASPWDVFVDNNFLHSAPGNPLQVDPATGRPSILVGAAAASGTGWVWDDANGKLYAVNAAGAQADW